MIWLLHIHVWSEFYFIHFIWLLFFHLTVNEGWLLPAQASLFAVAAVCSLSVSWWEERCDFPTSAPTMYFYIPAYVWLAQPEFRIPKSSQIGITFLKKSGWCNDFHFLKSTPDLRPTRRKDICCTWDPSQVGNAELDESGDRGMFLRAKWLLMGRRA